MKSHGCLDREEDSEKNVADYLFENQYKGCRIYIDNLGDYKYFTFYGKKEQEGGMPSVYAYDTKGNVIAGVIADCRNIDDEWHPYVLDLSKAQENILIIMNGAYVNNTGEKDACFAFRDMTLY